MIGQLIANGYAYQATNGDVMYDVHKFVALRKTVGQEARRPARRIARRGGHRQARSARLRVVEIREAGRTCVAFAVGRWPPGLAHRMFRDVDEGTRRATSTSTAAGSISSSRITKTRSRRPAAPRTRSFAEIWMHNGFLNIDNEKMSKSLGNFFTTREVLAKIKHPEVLRFFLLSSHYRGPDELFAAAARTSRSGAHAHVPRAARHAASAANSTNLAAATASVQSAMDDDFNTPEAIAVLQGLARELNMARDAGESATASASSRPSCVRWVACSASSVRIPRNSCAVPPVPVRPGSDANGAPKLPGLNDAEIDRWWPPDRRPQGEELRRIRPYPRSAGGGRA